MNRSTRPFVSLAGLLTGAYFVLAIMSVTCAAEHPEPRTSGHHHGGAFSHSNFCAWACQANPPSDAGPSTLVLHPFFVVAGFIEDDHAAVAGGGLFAAASRGPPHRS